MNLFKGAFRTRLHPSLSWGASTLSVLGAVLIPALLSFPFVRDFPNIDPGMPEGAVTLLWFGWHVGAAFVVSPMFLPVTIVLATPTIWLLLRFGWTGYLSLIGMALLVGLPAAHVALNGDLTTEAPGMIPVLVTAFLLQAILSGLILRLLSKRKFMRAEQEPADQASIPQK